MGVETEKKEPPKTADGTTATPRGSTLEDIRSALEEMLNSDETKETTRKAAADSLITLDKYRREIGQQDKPDKPPEWFTAEFVGRVVQYMKETFAKGGLIDAEAEGQAGASFELSQEGNG